jgi:PAS domain S-box-containing protein
MHILKNLRLRRHSPLLDSHTEPSPAELQSELRNTERRLEALLDQLPYVVLYETGAGREYISRNISELLGFRAEEFTSERGNFPKIIHPDDAARMFPELSAWNAAGRPGIFRAQFRVRKKSGEYIWLEDQIVGADHSDGTQSMIGVMVDVTARRADQERYRAIVEAADAAGIGLGIFFDRDGDPELVFMNDSLHQIGGWSVEELRERGLFSLVQGTHYDETTKVWKSFLDGSLVKHSLETEILHKSGEYVPISIGLSATRIDDERAIIAFISDIGERKRAEQELIRAKLEAEEMSRIKSNILANFSHELRTPMHSILGFSSMLVEELQHSELRTYARSIQRSGERLLDTLTSIIELAALESSPGEIALLPVPLAKVVESTIDELRQEFSDRNLRCDLVVRDASPIVLLDVDKFKKAVEKILHNAIKFTSVGGITITVERISVEQRGRMEGRAAVRIRDTGVGMSQDFIDTAFEKFKQESTGLGRSFEGAGLGLTLAKGYLRLMNGTISIASNPTEGTEVTLTLPIVG